MVHVGVQHGRYGRARAEALVGLHLFRRTLVVGGRHDRRGPLGFAALGYRDPRAGGFREGRTELWTAGIKKKKTTTIKINT